MSELRICYRQDSARTMMIYTSLAAVMALGATLAAPGALMGPAGTGWTIALCLIASLAWWIVFRFHQGSRARAASRGRQAGDRRRTRGAGLPEP